MLVLQQPLNVRRTLHQEFLPVSPEEYMEGIFIQKNWNRFALSATGTVVLHQLPSNSALSASDYSNTSDGFCCGCVCVSSYPRQFTHSHQSDVRHACAGHCSVWHYSLQSRPAYKKVEKLSEYLKWFWATATISTITGNTREHVGRPHEHMGGLLHADSNNNRDTCRLIKLIPYTDSPNDSLD